MMRWLWLCLPALLAWGCSQRTVAVPDGAGGGDAGPSSCTALTKVAQVALEAGERAKNAPSVAFDGERFAVLWHSQPAVVSSMNGELRFSRVDRSGAASSASGVSLQGDNGVMEAALLVLSPQYAALYQPIGPAVGPTLLRFGADGKPGLTNPLPGGNATRTALAPHPEGAAALLAGPGGSPRALALDFKPVSVPASGSLPTAEAIAAVWLDRRPGGYVAALHTENANASLHLLDDKLARRSQARIRPLPEVRSADFVTYKHGFAALVAGSNKIALELFSAAGSSTAQRTLGTIPALSGTRTRQVSLAWTGEQLLAAYPASVPGQYELLPLDAAGKPAGSAMRLPRCLAVSSELTMAWGGDRLAVVSLDQASGPSTSCVCVTVLRCR